MPVLASRAVSAVACAVALALVAAAMGSPGGPSRPVAAQPAPVPEFGDAAARELVVIGNRADGLDVPRDLAFHPNRPYELWVASRATDGTVLFFDPGTPAERVEDRRDSHRNHFMEEVSSIAFGDFGNFATCQESRNTYDGRSAPNDFMGPSLWTADLDIYARVNQRRLAGEAEGHVPRSLPPGPVGESAPGEAGANPFGLPAELVGFCRPLGDAGGAAAPGDVAAGLEPDQPRNPELGSHIDMLHQSPLCMGIAHEHGNAYWVADGTAGHLVRYDFAVDHGPGWDDHSDGIVRRYPEAAIERVADVPSHLALDAATGWLYAADTGGGRVIRLDVASGRRAARLTARNEPLAELSRWDGAAVEVFARGLRRPSGLALVRDSDDPDAPGRLFVGDHATGEIVAYDLATGDELGRLRTGARGLAGLEVGPDGRLYFVDMDADTVTRIDPDGAVPYDPPPVTPRPTLAPSPTPGGPTSAPPTATPTEEATPTASATATAAATDAPTDEPTVAPTATEEPTATEPPAAPRLFAPWVGAGRR